MGGQAQQAPFERGLIQRWAPVAAWVALIWFFSTERFTGERTSSALLPVLAALFPSATPHDLVVLHRTLRKLGHFTEYLVLSVLLYRALRTERAWSPRAAGAALVLAALHAIVDELHQSFVPGRVGAAADCLIDVYGAAAGQGLVIARFATRRPG